jgi:hypothetical protein
MPAVHAVQFCVQNSETKISKILLKILFTVILVGDIPLGLSIILK